VNVATQPRDCASPGAAGSRTGGSLQMASRNGLLVPAGVVGAGAKQPASRTAAPVKKWNLVIGLIGIALVECGADGHGAPFEFVEWGRLAKTGALVMTITEVKEGLSRRFG